MMKQLTKKLFTFYLLVFGFYMTNAQNLFWEEDFSTTMGLPAGWTTEDASGGDGVWAWCANMDQITTCIPNWAQYSNQHSNDFFANSVSNGFVFMDSDILSEVNPNHIVRLTTDAIDCSGQPEVWARFESLIGVFGVPATNNALLRVSTNGTDWTDFNIFEISLADRWSDNPEISVIDISAVAAGEATVYLQFSWTGNWEYYWLLDDLQLYDANPRPPHDMRVNDNFYAIAPNALTPVSQIETFGFLADIENVGSMDQTNVNLNITIVDDSNSDTVYTEDKFYGTIVVDSLAENDEFDGEGFTPPAVPNKSYTGTYTVTADSVDMVMDNNSQSFQFFISDTTFAKENGATTSILPAAGNWEGENEPHSWAYGNYFYVPNGDGMYARTVSFGIGNASDPGVSERILTVYLYEWEDANFDGNADPDERERIAYNIYPIVGNEALEDLITLPLLEYPSAEMVPIPLSDDTEYIVMLEYHTIDEVDVEFAASTEFDYGAMVDRADSIGVPRYGSMLGINGVLDDEPFSSLGFGYNRVPVVRLSIGDTPITTSVKNLLADDNKMLLSPNPAKNTINLQLDLAEVQNKATVKIFDVDGKQLQEHRYDQVQNQTMTYDVSMFASGTYFLHLITEAGIKTTRFVVQH